MFHRDRIRGKSRRAGWLAAFAGLTAAGLVCAQPTPPPATAAPPQETVPKSEEAPPAGAVPVPAPTPTPPITEKEVAPAPPVEETPKAPVAPQRRERYDVAILQALDKVTAETLRFEARVGQPVRYKTLIFTVKACERSAPDEAIEDSVAYVTIDSQPRTATALAPKQAFKGWMYASSPGLHALEHPVYDAWLITCRAASPVGPAAPAAPAR